MPAVRPDRKRPPPVFNPHGVQPKLVVPPKKGGQDEPTVRFGQSATDFNAVGEFLTCTINGGRKVRGGVGEKRIFSAMSTSGPTSTDSSEKRLKADPNYSGITSSPIPPGPPSQTKLPPIGPPPPTTTAIVQKTPTDPNLATIVSGIKQIDTGLRNTAAEYVKNNFWTITGTTAAASGLATCFGPGVALIPIICTAIASYSPTLAAFIQSPEARTVSDMKRAIQESKEKDRQRIQALIDTADKDQKLKYQKLKGALDRLSNIAASVPDVPTSSTKIVEVIENINKEVKELPKSEEVMDVVPTSQQIESSKPTGPTGGSRHRTKRRHRPSAPTRKRRSSSARRRGDTR
jgi:hypothetical protein